MQESQIILGDWGTTSLRLHLCNIDHDGTPEVIGSVSAPGARYVSDFPETLLDAISRLPQHSCSDAVLAGMVGSSIGWRGTAYLSCPAGWLDIPGNTLTLSAGRYRVTILPGASCITRSGYYDVMRGEEAQLLGVSRLHSLGRSRVLAALPGTHTKWAVISAAGLERFATSMPGELFDLLQSHSILAPPRPATIAQPRPIKAAVFDSAVDLLCLNRELGLIQGLFSTRSRMLAGEFAADDASSYLSGLLIGADVRDVCEPVLRAEAIDQPVLVIGDNVLSELYARAMTRYGIEFRLYAGDDCSVRGLAACYHMLHRGRAVEV